MAQEQLKAFLAKVKADTNLQKQLKAATNADAVVTIAKQANFIVTVEEIKQAQAHISDEEIEGLAGGWRNRGTDLTCWRN